MSRDLIVHFRNEETLRNLERTAEALGIPMDELAEAALEITALSIGMEERANPSSSPISRRPCAAQWPCSMQPSRAAASQLLIRSDPW